MSLRQVRSAEDDETYLNLIHEVDVERERRWKAEQATRKLLDNVKALKETRKRLFICTTLSFKFILEKQMRLKEKLFDKNHYPCIIT